MVRCSTCGGWVDQRERLTTDFGIFHDRDSCLPAKHFEAQVERYNQFDIGLRDFYPAMAEYVAHLEEEHREDQEDTSYWEMKEDGPFGGGGAVPASADERVESRAGVDSSDRPTYYSTQELAARERRFMDARLP